jgi:hypothetical protein
MIDLRPLIHRFVDDVLQAIQDASVDELRELVGAEGQHRRGPGRTRTRQSGPQPARRVASRRSGRPRLRVGVHAVSVARAREARATVADITDPEALLAAAAAEARAKAKAPQPTHTAAKPLELLPSPGAEHGTAHVETAPSEPPPPPSGPKLVLRPDESLARASEHGVVIRRRKRVAP